MFELILLFLAGLLIVSVAWELYDERAKDLDEEEHHRRLLRELRRHD